MDYVAWCDLVLNALVELARNSASTRTIGAHRRDVTIQVAAQSSTSRQYEAEVLDALMDLRSLGLVEGDSTHYWKMTSLGRELAPDTTPLWQSICQTALDAEHQDLLGVVNQLSQYSAEDHAGTNWVEGAQVFDALGWDDGDLLYPVAKELEDLGFVGMRAYLGGDTKLHTSYRGLAWETRRGFTIESAFIDQLVHEWETTSVDFKRELETRTADQKAEFVKDVLGLANTQASGQRWMIIGFEDETRSYWGPPDAKLNRNHFEQLLSQYTAPMVQVRYDVVDYREGPVGKLEVLREQTKLPYQVVKSIGDKKRIEQGQIFVRYGSQTEAPTPAELVALEDEARRARGE